MSKYLILVKHSLPGIIENVPAREWRLSEEGRVRARRLAERLSSYQPEVIVSSVEPKAKETAEIIARTYDLTMEIVEGLHEHDRSRSKYLSPDDFRASVRKFFENPTKLVFGNETADECHTRFDQAVRTVLKLYVDKSIVIVAHGTVISLFVSRLTGNSDLILWNELGLPSFVVLDIQSATLIERENII
jgi:broad specificity phosphatase PhoE